MGGKAAACRMRSSVRAAAVLHSIHLAVNSNNSEALSHSERITWKSVLKSMFAEAEIVFSSECRFKLKSEPEGQCPSLFLVISGEMSFCHTRTHDNIGHRT
jgi:hypothetical protein